jgi:hypothetical protein
LVLVFLPLTLLVAGGLAGPFLDKLMMIADYLLATGMVPLPAMPIELYRQRHDECGQDDNERF